MRWLAVIVLAACGSTQAPGPSEHRAPALAQLEASHDLDGAAVGRGAVADRATIVIVFASWCTHCKRALAEIAEVRAAHPNSRVLGVNYRGHEEYDGRGSATAVRAYVAASAPWLRVVPADDALFTALGRPPKVPTIFVFDARGQLVVRFDRRVRATPDAAELAAVLGRLGA